ncbi:MAG TPA: HEAT repeat domain-containing protein [Oscillatoriaceae cyanobacterium M33_DOE_052]|nr:HEAT repeat domain-containing protein [Oscillatoriaceae cyanobacterium M33_DOE_052]
MKIQLCQANPVLGMKSYPDRLLFLITSFCLSLAPATTGANTLPWWEVSPNLAAPEVGMLIFTIHNAATTDKTPHLGGMVKPQQAAPAKFPLASAVRPGTIAQNSEPKKTSSKRRWLPLLLLSLATITGAAIFAGVFYLLTRSGDRDEELGEESTSEIEETSNDSTNGEAGFLGVNGRLPLQGDPETGRRGDGETGRRGSASLTDRGDGEMERLGETGRRGDGETGNITPVAQSPNPPVQRSPAPEVPISPHLPPSLPISPPPLSGVPQEVNQSISEPDMMQELIRCLYSADAAKRRQAIWELGWRGDSRGAQSLVDLMLTSDSKQRSLILAALSEIGTRTLTPLERALAISLQDRNPDVRKNAIRDLTRIYESIGQISQMLRLAVEDSDPEVQETARWALEQLGRLRTHTSSNNRSALPTWTVPEDNSSEQIP